MFSASLVYISGWEPAVYLWLGLGNPRLAIPIRTGPFWASVQLTFAHAKPLWLIRTGVVLVMVAGGLVVANIWCRFLCPTGGLLELLKRFSIYGVYKADDCSSCDKCLRGCAMATRPAESNCTNCGDCIAQCPENAIKIGRSKPVQRTIISGE